MTKKMIIDATHPEETRVAIIDHNNQLTDFDFESANKVTVRSNIYLAKVARVEPSLQAAFIDYGGNRHGFLAFSEIHPDYFRIPVSDRELLNEEMQKLSLAQEVREESLDNDAKDTFERKNTSSQEEMSEFLSSEFEKSEDKRNDSFTMPIDIIEGETSAHDDEDFVSSNRPPLHQMYKIQEVIHKNQILLVQVVKEERGLKGAALTTYLSLAGRYSVLMANSAHSGGISRKISNSADRLRLKKIIEELEIPEGMGLIVRTAGRERTKAEIKRDADFLKRAWNDIRNLTLESTAPCLIHEEDDIIKRAIRDLYSKDVDEIQVEGEEGYKVARLFMKNLMPSHTKRIHHYKDEHMPLFYKYKVEAQIDEMHNPMVHLPSGGSIVIHPTEALVSIDINSGRSTRERHIEETAVKTNLEAADEIARQVRLRDLAGLIVIDFIDMDENRNIVSVERRLHEAFRQDRARIQMAKISPFGLLELSRQRIRPSLLETSAHPCPHCQATGFIRSTESSALHMLRAIEEEASLGKMAEFQIHVPTNVAFYLLNTKRDHLQRIESRLKVRIFVEGDDSLISPQHRITCLKRRTSDSLEELKNLERSTASQRSSIPTEIESKIDQEEDILTTESNSSETSSSISASKRQRQRRSRRRAQKNRQSILENSPISPSEENKEDFKKDTAVEEIFASEDQSSEKQISPHSENSQATSDTREQRRQHPFKRKRRRYPKSLQNRSSDTQQTSEFVQTSDSLSSSISNVLTEIPSLLEQEVTQNIQSSPEKRSFVESEQSQPSSQNTDSQNSESLPIEKKKSANPWWKRLRNN